MPGAIVNNPALGGDVDRALLLALRALFKVAVTEELQVDQTQANGTTPEKKNSAEEIEPVACADAGITRRHDLIPDEP